MSKVTVSRPIGERRLFIRKTSASEGQHASKFVLLGTNKPSELAIKPGLLNSILLCEHIAVAINEGRARVAGVLASSLDARLIAFTNTATDTTSGLCGAASLAARESLL